MQIVTTPAPWPRKASTATTIYTVRVDAVVYYCVLDPVKVVVDVQNYEHAIGQVAEASCAPSSARATSTTCCPTVNDSTRASNSCSTPRPGLGRTDRPRRDEDVALPETMKRSMSRQAEAERERRSRVITAEGELEASRKPAESAEVMTEHPAHLQLAYRKPSSKSPPRRTPPLSSLPVQLLRSSNTPHPRRRHSDSRRRHGGHRGRIHTEERGRPDQSVLTDEPPVAGSRRRRGRRGRLGRGCRGLGDRRGRGPRLPLRVVHAFRPPLPADAYGSASPIDSYVTAHTAAQLILGDA